jgi:hypothetical protein
LLCLIDLAIVTKNRQPIEFIIAPGSFSDIAIAKKFKFNIPLKSTVQADRAYTDYDWEDNLEFKKQIFLAAKRRKNSKRKEKNVNSKTRKVIETSFSEIVNQFARKIHAVTAKGFELKIALFVFAYSFKYSAPICQDQFL